jgi:antitoxin component YwqK of YwqJK toxin-antitoxin module
MNLQECEVLLSTAIKLGACKGNADAARRYLNAGDVDGFERVCRGNYDWLRYKDIAYVLTNGPAERWYVNGQKLAQFNYLNGKLHGECTWWHDNGQVCEQFNYVNGEMHGLHKWWYSDGQIREQSNYVNGKRHGEYAWWYPDGRVCKQANYVNGVKQP